jgi:hypothetical protein
MKSLRLDIRWKGVRPNDAAAKSEARPSVLSPTWFKGSRDIFIVFDRGVSK